MLDGKDNDKSWTILDKAFEDGEFWRAE